MPLRRRLTPLALRVKMMTDSTRFPPGHSCHIGPCSPPCGLSSDRVAVVWCCGGALRLDPGELLAGVDAVLIEADADAVRQADEIGRGLQAAGVTVRIGERGRGDVAEALALRISEHYHERAAVLEYDGERPRSSAVTRGESRMRLGE